MRNILLLLSLVISICIACKKEECQYPMYEVSTISYVPEDMKELHHLWIIETIRAASEHMTGGNYSDVDQTIIQAKWTADELFEKQIIGLRKSVNDKTADDIYLKPQDMTLEERQIFHRLYKEKK